MANKHVARTPTTPPAGSTRSDVFRVLFGILVFFTVSGASQGLHEYAAIHPQSGFWDFVLWGWRLDTISGVRAAIGLLIGFLAVPNLWNVIGPFILAATKNTGEFLVAVARAVRGVDLLPRPNPNPDPLPPPPPTKLEIIFHALKVAITGIAVYALFGLNRGVHEYVSTLHSADLWQFINHALEVNLSQGAYFALTWVASCFAGPDLWKIVGPVVSAAADKTTEFAKNIGRAFRKGGRHLEEPRDKSSVFTLDNLAQAVKVFITVVLYYSGSGINKGVQAWALTVHPVTLRGFLSVDLRADSSRGALVSFVWLLSIWAGPAVWTIVSPVLNSASRMAAEFIGKFRFSLRLQPPPPTGNQDSSDD